MRIVLQFAFAEKGAANLLQWLAVHKARAIRALRLPLLYASGVRYQREPVEAWLDYPSLLEQGHEDCDGLAAARAGELMARGAAALSPEDGGYALARDRKLDTIEAMAFLRTRREGLYHCVVRYRVGRTWYWDDPSARLGMFGPDRTENPFSDLSEEKILRREARREARAS